MNLHRTWVFVSAHQTVEPQGSVVFWNENKAPRKVLVDLELRDKFPLGGAHDHLIAIRKPKLVGIARAHLDIRIICDRIQDLGAF